MLNQNVSGCPVWWERAKELEKSPSLSLQIHDVGRWEKQVCRQCCDKTCIAGSCRKRNAGWTRGRGAARCWWKRRRLWLQRSRSERQSSLVTELLADDVNTSNTRLWLIAIYSCLYSKACLYHRTVRWVCVVERVQSSVWTLEFFSHLCPNQPSDLQ